MTNRYFCQYCNTLYNRSQEKLTPGFCSIKCRLNQEELDRQPGFRDLLQHDITNRNKNQKYNSLEPIQLARDPNPVATTNHCETCGIDGYMNKPIRLILTHMDGNTNNDIPSNRRYLCPNCASQHKDTLR